MTTVFCPFLLLFVTLAEWRNEVADQAYTRVAIALHWLMAGLIAAGFGLGLSMVGLPLSPTKIGRAHV